TWIVASDSHVAGVSIRRPVTANRIRYSGTRASALGSRCGKMRGPSCKNLVHESGTERTAQPHRLRHANRQALPALLAAGTARRRAARARLSAGAREDPGRAPDRVPRHPEPLGTDRRILRAPRRVALVRPQRGRRPALLLS